MRPYRGSPRSLAVVTLAIFVSLTQPIAGKASGAPAPPCASNAECSCGWNAVRASCELGAPGAVDATANDCMEFCRGYSTGLEAVCRAGACVRTAPSPCPGDCDADATVSVAEVMAAVGIALGENPLAACRAVDRNADGAATIDELLPAVRAVLDGCATTLASGGDEVMLYDTRVTVDNRPAVDALGTRFTLPDGNELSITLGPNDRLDLQAMPNPDGSLDIEGWEIVTDVGYSISGTARTVDTSGEERIEGSLAPAPGGFARFESLTFIMRRELQANVARFAGRYRLALSRSPGNPNQSSTLILTIEVASNGMAVLSGGADVAGDAARLGTLTSGTCSIAPQGSLSCSADYLAEPSGGSTLFRLTGKLTELAAGVSGGGAYLAGIDPPVDGFYVPGSWTAQRIAP